MLKWISQSKSGLILLAITLMGFFLRVYHLEEKSLWSDEICTIASAMGNSVDPNAVEHFDPERPQSASFYLAKATTPHGFLALKETTRVLKQNVHPPFYFWIMNPIIYSFGTSASAIRSLSVIFSTLCIPMLFCLGRALGGTCLGLLGASIFAFSGYQVAHAQDARQYALLSLLALTSGWVTFRLSKRSQKIKSYEWVGFMILSTIGLYTQYFYGFFIISQVLYGILLNYKNQNFLKKLGLSLLGVFILFSPWLLVLKEQLSFLKKEGHYTTGLWKPIQLPEILWRVLSDFVAPQEVFGKVLITILLSYGIFIGMKKLKDFHLSSPLFFILCWLGSLIALQIGFDLIKHSHTLSIRRYTILAAPSFYLLISYIVLHLKENLKWIQTSVISLLIGLMIWNSSQVVNGKKLHSDDYRQAAQWINQNALTGDTVLVHKSGAIVVGMSYYLKPNMALLGLPLIADTQNKEVKVDPVAKRVSNTAKQSKRIWLILSHSSKRVFSRIDEQLRMNHYGVMTLKKFPGVQIFLYTSQKTKS